MQPINQNNISLPCLGCHAAQDNSIPNINGLSSDYFISAFTAYKDNKRDHFPYLLNNILPLSIIALFIGNHDFLMK